MERRVSHLVRDTLAVVSCYAALIAAGWIAVGLGGAVIVAIGGGALVALGLPLAFVYYEGAAVLPPARPRALTSACARMSEPVQLRSMRSSSQGRGQAQIRLISLDRGANGGFPFVGVSAVVRAAAPSHLES